jgi:hypothetical protein
MSSTLYNFGPPGTRWPQVIGDFPLALPPPPRRHTHAEFLPCLFPADKPRRHVICSIRAPLVQLILAEQFISQPLQVLDRIKFLLAPNRRLNHPPEANLSLPDPTLPHVPRNAEHPASPIPVDEPVGNRRLRCRGPRHDDALDLINRVDIAPPAVRMPHAFCSAAQCPAPSPRIASQGIETDAEHPRGLMVGHPAGRRECWVIALFHMLNIGGIGFVTAVVQSRRHAGARLKSFHGTVVREL